MFGNLFKRFKVGTSGIAGSALAANEETVMEGMVAAMVIVAYSDHSCTNEEVDGATRIIEASPQLKLFGNEPVRIFDSYCDQMEASFIQGRLDLLERVGKLSGDTKNSERVLIAAIEVAFADTNEDDENPISKTEDNVLSEIARTLDLRLGKYM